MDVSDPNGANWVGTVQAIFNWSTERPGSCTVMYSQVGNVLFLEDDAADGWLGDAAPGTANSNVSNSQCTLAISGASVTQSGNDLILSLPITFATSFIGPQHMFSIGQDHWGLSSDDPNNENFGTYTAVAAQAQVPTVTLTHTPDGASGTTFMLTASDVNGSSYIAMADLLLEGIGISNGSVTQCRVSYDRALNQFTLEPEAGGDTAVSWAPGTTVTAIRGNCQIDTVHTAAVPTPPNTVTLTVPVTVGSGAPSAVTAETDVIDHTAADPGPTVQGTWALTAGTLSLPVTSAPFGGGGGSGSFAVQASPGLAWTATTAAGWLHIQSGSGTGNGTVTYTVDYNFGGARRDSITVNGNVFTVNESALVFPPAATYTKTVSITPSQPSGVGPTTFTVDVSDPNGANWVGTVQTIFNWSTEGPGSCTVMYQQAGNVLFLLDDAADGWLGDVAPGTANSNVSNSQCTLAIGGASVTQSGNDLILSLPITFASSFIGPQQMFSIGQDHWGLTSDDANNEHFGTYTAVAARRRRRR